MITLEEIKRHLNIEPEFVADDTYLTSLIQVAEASVINYCDGTLTEDNFPLEAKHQAMLLVAHLYVNRTMVSFANGVEIPYSFKFLLAPYKNHFAV